MPKVQEYLNQKYPNKKVTEINISGWIDENNKWETVPDWEKLTGSLDLSDFPNLEKLNCSFNKITSLNLTNCPKLTELKCWENELTEIKFPSSQLKLKTLQAWTNNLVEIDWEKTFDAESLTYISISNNKFSKQNIEVFSKFINLEELYLGNDVGERLESNTLNRFYGSTKSLKDLTKLKKLQIEGTEVSLFEEIKIISWGKEAVIKNLKLTKEVAEELRQTRSKNEFQKTLNEVLINHARKHLGLNLTLEQEKEIEELGSDISNNAQPKSTNLEEKLKNLNQHWEKLIEKQKEDGQNEMIASIIPLERLYVIRGNLKQFSKKWGIKKSDGNNMRWYKKLLTKSETGNLSELSKLKSPKEIDESWWTRRESIYATQFIGRSAAVAGAALTFWDYGAIGGGILGVYPFSELAVSNMEKSREDRKNKWKEFLSDADTFLDNYNELLGILTQFEVNEERKGIVNKALKNLKEKNENFLEDYDKDSNKEIDIEELKENLDSFTQELNNESNNKIQEIIDKIKELEEAIIKYRKSSYYGERIEREDNKQEAQIEVNIHNNLK